MTLVFARIILLYADSKEMIPLNIPIIDKSIWMENRLSPLHPSLAIMKTPPAAEFSAACSYCKFANRCKKQDEGEPRFLLE